MTQQSVKNKINNARSDSADIFKIWNDDCMEYRAEDHPFYALLTKERILDALQNSFEVQYYADMTDRLGPENVDKGMLNIYDSFIYGMTHPEDPKVEGMEEICGQMLMHCLHHNKFRYL